MGWTVTLAHAADNAFCPVRVFFIADKLCVTSEARGNIDYLSRILDRDNGAEKGLDGHAHTGEEGDGAFYDVENVSHNLRSPPVTSRFRRATGISTFHEKLRS